MRVKYLSQLQLIVLMLLMSSLLIFIAACGSDSKENRGRGENNLNNGEVESRSNADGEPLELPEIVATDNNVFLEPMDIVNHFESFYIIQEYLNGNFLHLMYEWKGKENVDGVEADRVYFHWYYEDDQDDKRDYDIWFDEAGNAVKLELNGRELFQTPTIEQLNERMEEVFKAYLEAFEYFDTRYREALQDELWSIREMDIEKKDIAGHEVDVYTFQGKHDVTFDPEALFKIVLADFGDFEITLESEDTTAFGTDQKFEIEKMTFR